MNMGDKSKQSGLEHEVESDLPEQIRVRYEKREALLKETKNPYRNGLTPSSTSEELHGKFGEMTREELEAQKQQTSFAGRVMGLRDFGKGGFLRISDRRGEMQAYADKKLLSQEDFESYKRLDVGDIVYVRGYLFKTKTGELSIYAEGLTLLTKSLRPLPEKFHGLTDIETRYRQRYVDLMVNESTREIFRLRFEVIDEIRNFFRERDFLEVETPMLHPIQGGAVARPFRTHHNALDMPLFLRIAPELYLKRLLVGGMERVFEINRNFRNEGISIKHNPEFTMLEFYWAYATYEELMPLTEELFVRLSNRLLGGQTLSYEDTEINLSAPWPRLSVEQAILRFSGFNDSKQIRDPSALISYLKQKGHPFTQGMKPGEMQMVIFDEEVESLLIQPTFVTQYPVDVSPLARKNEADPFVTDRFELFIYGREIANGFSELNDPVDQRQRFEEQQAAKLAGNEEASDIDEDYLRALEYGMPPAAGEGIGIDRLVMLFTNASSIRDVILFPHLRPE